MNTVTIKESIQHWIAIREDATSINQQFVQGNCFSYDVPSYIDTSEEVHVYPGVNEGQLYFFVIPAAYDKDEYSDVISDYTEVCPIQTIVGGGNDHEITSAEAQARILAWENNYQTWVPQQIATVDGMFEAFSVAVQDFETQKVVMTLGLKESDKKGVYSADLIVTNDMGNLVAYDDFSRPVPPYSATASIESFYLLSV